MRFVVVGIASTLAYLLLYAALRGPADAQVANTVALLATALANTAANRRFTFGVRGRERLARQHVQALVAFGMALAVTSGALVALHAASRSPGRAPELTVLVLANLLATALRFTLLRFWVFRPLAAPRP